MLIDMSLIRPFLSGSLLLQTIQRYLYVIIFLGVAYLVLVRLLRYRRANQIASPFSNGRRPLSSMTTQEAFDIMTTLQSLEFPYAMNKARSVALLKASIPTTFV
jgi:heme/copper-type cytochrome/quinol oxidase subunit 2